MSAQIVPLSIGDDIESKDLIFAGKLMSVI